MKVTNQEAEQMLTSLKPLLCQRNKVGYVAARNTRVLSDTLADYIKFKNDLIEKYGVPDKDENGNELATISLDVKSPNFKKFMEEFYPIRTITQDISIMKLKYEETIDILSGEEILNISWMLEDE